jgi:hypothetical protein
MSTIDAAPDLAPRTESYAETVTKRIVADNAVT